MICPISYPRYESISIPRQKFISLSENNDDEIHPSLLRYLMGKYEEARAKQEKALSIYQTIKGTKREQANCYTNIGVALSNMGKYFDSLDIPERILVG